MLTAASSRPVSLGPAALGLVKLITEQVSLWDTMSGRTDESNLDEASCIYCHQGNRQLSKLAMMVQIHRMGPRALQWAS